MAGGGPNWPWVVGIAGAAGMGAYAIKTALDNDVLAQLEATVTGDKVIGLSRARVLEPRLYAALVEYNVSGPETVVIPRDGLVRTDEALQQRLFSQGLTKARSLSLTPHGRAGSVDLHPIGFRADRSFAAQGGVALWLPKFERIGTWFEAKGFTWGGRWRSFRSLEGVYGDQPHVELKDWSTLPFPPPDYTLVNA